MTARRIFRLLPALAVLAIVAVLAGCGTKQGTSVDEGQPVQLGDLQYNVEFSRFLNPDDVEDHGYLVGQPPSGRPRALPGDLRPDHQQEQGHAGDDPDQLDDHRHPDQSYFPVPSKSPYALPVGAPIGPEDQAPALDSTPQVGPIGASMVLFLIPDTAASENRPLTLSGPRTGRAGPDQAGPLTNAGAAALAAARRRRRAGDPAAAVRRDRQLRRADRDHRRNCPLGSLRAAPGRARARLVDDARRGAAITLVAAGLSASSPTRRAGLLAVLGCVLVAIAVAARLPGHGRRP